MQTNPVKAIREKCLECSNGSIREVELCPVTGCALYPFRFGKNPYRKPRTLNEEQRSKLLAASKNTRFTKNNGDSIEGKTANPPAEGKLRLR